MKYFLYTLLLLHCFVPVCVQARSNFSSPEHWIGARRIGYGSIGRTDTASVPALIPMPQQVRWTNTFFNIAGCKAIEIASANIRAGAVQLQQRLNDLGFRMNIVQPGTTTAPRIILNIGKVSADRHVKEAYHLTVDKAAITITANTPHGIFNAIQTLAQMVMPNRQVRGCSITDFPAFAWRGYMVDVGRNYQSPGQLKEQIDMMARYKLNIFHFHLTEDIAWRLQIKKFPQLTAPEITQRNKGSFYTVEQMQDLIQYCAQRHIILVPEIDVPGHSGAFKRAMGVDMQSRQGTQWVKEIFEEIGATYNIPYLHIGADEVKITNPTFIAEISDLVRKHKKEVIAWAPGAKYDDGVIRQLWKDEGADDLHKPTTRYIDSRALYISDFDPLNSVVTIFNRRIGGKAYGDSALLGAEFCLWNDRNVKNETELLSRNAVYPSMLAFAERSWQGNGYPNIAFSIGEPGSASAASFAEFEQRLLEHKNKYFKKLPFTYVAQMHMQWKLIGPFNNYGSFDSAYWPELPGYSLLDSAAITAIGGTVWLWHTHSPKVKAWLPSARENTTWYAYTQFWSDSSGILPFWLGTKDLSRSGADATPPKGAWDYTGSSIRINGNVLPPPAWQLADQPSGRLDVPMTDENFYYRKPAPVPVKKGWNEILVKLPMGKFDPLADWQVPPKWMFTVIPVQEGNGMNPASVPLRFRAAFDPH
ncbi:MAG: beta-N-acetylhexosaminidase [Chitinophagaceae bacterium]|nr:beta-N-acetylhexosaminidase [Chitinophagaceae bacterium]